jgi:hypothetical protein
MKNLNRLGIGLATLAVVLALATSARASIVLTQTSGPTDSGSWTIGWTASGGTFDEIVGTILAGDQFENSPNPGMVAAGWTSLPGVGANSSTASISDGPVSSLLFSTTFTGTPADLPEELITFQFFNASSLVANFTLQWNGSEFDSVPEPTTIIAGSLLLLPLGMSMLRILRKQQIV